jgi:uncharacterized protein YcaQ
VTHQLTRDDARRISVRAQLLAEPRPGELLEVVRHLTLLQLDPTASVAPAADLVLWSRLGSTYDVGALRQARDDLALIEHQGTLRTAEYLSLLRADMALWPGPGDLKPWQVSNRDWVEANGGCRHEILALLRSEGPLPSRDLPDSCAVPWRSSGWTNHQNVTRLLEFMVARGEVATAGREGRERLWDLAERVYPDEVVPSEEAAVRRNELRLTSLGIARSRCALAPGEPFDVGDVGEEAVIEGVKGTWRVDPAQLGQPFEGRTVLLSPFDRLVKDRKRLAEIFEFDYFLEMFKPVTQRRWGYYALPILHGDRLVGKLDATVERSEGVLRVDAIHEDAGFDSARESVAEEIEDLARWLGVEVLER